MQSPHLRLAPKINDMGTPHPWSEQISSQHNFLLSTPTYTPCAHAEYLRAALTRKVIPEAFQRIAYKTPDTIYTNTLCAQSVCCLLGLTSHRGTIAERYLCTRNVWATHGRGYVYGANIPMRLTAQCYVVESVLLCTLGLCRSM